MFRLSSYVLAVFFLLEFCSCSRGATGQVASASRERKRLKPAATARTAGPSAAARVPNSIFITTVAKSDRPYTISRVFAQSEIPRFAQAVVDGSPVPTQCDVKTRWPDGSVAHAMISFWAASASNKITVDFVDQETGNNDFGYGLSIKRRHSRLPERKEQVFRFGLRIASRLVFSMHPN